MRRFATFLVLGALMAGLPAHSETLPPGSVLERAVVLVRHGVRSPTETPAKLAADTGATWPGWPVPPGEMTNEGAAALGVMGRFLHDRYTTLGVLPRGGCEGMRNVAVWADRSDDRTRQSGQILAKTLGGTCGLAAHWQQTNGADPVFDAASAGICPFDQTTAMTALQHASAVALPASVTRAENALVTAVAPDACTAHTKLCADTPGKISWKNGEPHLSGPLAIGATAGESLLLAYEQGLPPRDIAHARDETQARRLLDEVLPVHTYESALTRALPALASHSGAVLGRVVLAELEGERTRLLVLAGHDTTQSRLAALTGLEWVLPEQPDPTAPDTAIALEVWRLPTGVSIVRAFAFYQTPDQVRHHSDAAPHILALSPTECRGRTCALSTFASHVTATTAPSCVPAADAAAAKVESEF